MWIFLSHSMLSIVTTPNQPDMLTVRARAKEDIENVFPEVSVTHTPNRDYAYRAVIKRDRVGQRVGELARQISADNFKNSVTEEDRHDAYLKVWSAMFTFQRARSHANRA